MQPNALKISSNSAFNLVQKKLRRSPIETCALFNLNVMNIVQSFLSIGDISRQARVCKYWSKLPFGPYSDNFAKEFLDALFCRKKPIDFEVDLFEKWQRAFFVSVKQMSCLHFKKEYKRINDPFLDKMLSVTINLSTLKLEEPSLRELFRFSTLSFTDITIENPEIPHNQFSISPLSLFLVNETLKKLKITYNNSLFDFKSVLEPNLEEFELSIEHITRPASVKLGELIEKFTVLKKLTIKNKKRFYSILTPKLISSLTNLKELHLQNPIHSDLLVLRHAYTLHTLSVSTLYVGELVHKLDDVLIELKKSNSSQLKTITFTNLEFTQAWQLEPSDFQSKLLNENHASLNVCVDSLTDVIELSNIKYKISTVFLSVDFSDIWDENVSVLEVAIDILSANKIEKIGLKVKCSMRAGIYYHQFRKRLAHKYFYSP